MDNEPDKYREEFLHWIWESLHFDFRQTTTVSGERLTILDPGEHNRSDGPDFKNAKLQIGGLEWHGDVEIHWKVRDWRHHGHHCDPHYNRVVLHVVYCDPSGVVVRRNDGTSPYTLFFKPCLPANLNRLIEMFNRQDRLPCSGHLDFISLQAFEKQIGIAQNEYFEAKTEELLSYYDSRLPPATAWKRLLILGLFDGLGIALNRQPMRELGRSLFELRRQFPSLGRLKRKARILSGFRDSGENRKASAWQFKSCRPNNRPEVRIEQAAELMWEILPTTYRDWSRQEPTGLWNRLIGNIRTRPGIGTGRSRILYGTVFLPALYLLGNLFHGEKLKQRAFALWLAHRPAIPDSLFEPFQNSNLPPRLYKRRLGAIYQLKHYCKPRRCQDCEVLKQVISS